MSLGARFSGWLRPVFYLGHNALTTLGAVLTTGSAITMVGFWALEVLQLRPIHPYAGMILFLVLPAVFVFGLLLMPTGLLWRRRRLVARGELPPTFPPIDLHTDSFQRAFTLFVVFSVANVAILSTASYKGVEHMDSVQFCGLTCHTVMAPEYTAYLESPHSRIACAECHIGSGAPWFVRSKLSGTRQLFAVAFGTYSRPIPTPVQHLRPARETCEQCHWPQKFHGDKFIVRTHFAADEQNTPSTTVLVVKVGGHSGSGGVGIHGRHLDENARIAYVAIDEHRQVIPRVSYQDDSGKTVDFVSTELKATQEQLASGEHRSMDCMDCHNRPSHTFELPERAVDRALSEGRIDRSLPFVKKKAIELLKAEYPDRDSASNRISSGLVDYYKTTYPDAYREHRALVEAAAQQVKAIYLKNVFPEMKVKWGTYPNNLGHEDFMGCFRCHDDNHKSSDGRVISQDCTACHEILAQDEEDPKVLAQLGIH